MSSIAQAWRAIAVHAEGLRSIFTDLLGHTVKHSLPKPFKAPALSLPPAHGAQSLLAELGIGPASIDSHTYLVPVNDALRRLRLLIEERYACMCADLAVQDETEGCASREEYANSAARRFRVEYQDNVAKLREVIQEHLENRKRGGREIVAKMVVNIQSPNDSFVGPIRSRNGFTDAQNETLLKLWERTDQLDKREVAIIARRLDLSKDQIRKWFSNRRTRSARTTTQRRPTASARRRQERVVAEDEESRIARMEPVDRYLTLQKDGRWRGSGLGLSMPVEFWTVDGFSKPHSGIQLDNDYYKWSGHHFEPLNKTSPPKKVTFADTMPRWESFFFGGEYQGRRVRWTHDRASYSRPSEAESMLKRSKKRGADEMEDWESDEIESPSVDFSIASFNLDEPDIPSFLSEGFVQSQAHFNSRPLQARSDDLVYAESEFSPSAKPMIPDFFAELESDSMSCPSTPLSQSSIEDEMSPEVSEALREFDVLCNDISSTPSQTPAADAQMFDLSVLSYQQQAPGQLSASQLAQKLLTPPKDARFQAWRASRPPVHVRLGQGLYSASSLSKEILADEDSTSYVEASGALGYSDSGYGHSNAGDAKSKASRLSQVEKEALSWFKDPVSVVSKLKSPARLNKFSRKVSAKTPTPTSEHGSDADNESTASESLVSSQVESQGTYVVGKNAMVERWIASDVAPRKAGDSAARDAEELHWREEQKLRLEQQERDNLQKWQKERPLRREVRMLSAIDQYYQRMAKTVSAKVQAGMKSILKKPVAASPKVKLEFGTDSLYPDTFANEYPTPSESAGRSTSPISSLFDEFGEFQPEAFDRIPVVKNEFADNEDEFDVLDGMDIDEILNNSAVSETSTLIDADLVSQADQWWVSSGREIVSVDATMRTTDELLDEALSTLGSF